jgi:hypothetical protein
MLINNPTLVKLMKPLVFVIASLIASVLVVNLVFPSNIAVNGQITGNNTSGSSMDKSTEFIINIRGISSLTEPNMVALISTEDDVQAKKVDLDKAIIQPGEENSFSPTKTIDVPILMSKTLKPNSEVMACVLQLGSNDYSQQVKCNTVFSQAGSTGEPQKIIVPL